MCGVEARDAFGRGDEAEELDARCTGALERGDGARRAAAGGEHRIEEEEITLGGVTRDLEVVVHRLERVVVAVEADVSDACARHQLEDTLDHAEARAQDGHQRELLACHPVAGHGFQRRVHGDRGKCEVGGGLIGHQHRNLVHQFLEDLLGRRLVAQQCQLVLHEGMRDDGEAGGCGGGRHGRQGSNFGAMKEYQAVILRLTRHRREDEDALTDLLNERSRGGWTPTMMTQDGQRLTLVFARDADAEG